LYTPLLLKNGKIEHIKENLKVSFVNYEVWKAKEVAEKYLSGVRGAVPLAQVQIEIMVRIIDSCNVKIEKILDLGCGDGILSAAVLQQYPHASCVLLDISEPMLQAAKEKLVNYNDKLSFLLLDYGDSRWIEKVKIAGPFDVIISGFSIHHQNDDRKQELYSEIFELLKSGGLFLNLEHVSSSSEWVSSLFDEYFIDSLYNMHLRNDAGKTRQEVADELYRRDDKAANILAPVEQQCEWLRNIGFQDVDCYFKIFELALFGGRKQNRN
jgi:ubiquinone/menaquinone biosynthesis C-methylase UbiE